MKAEKLIINGEEQQLFDWDYSSLDNLPTLWTAASKDVWTSAWEVPVLDANWKLDSSIVPSTWVMTSYTVTNKSDLTTLTTAVKWDIWIVTSENKTYILSSEPYSTLSNWTELLFPTGSVSSVNWFTWAVNLTTGYIQESNNNLFVSPTEKATWNNKLWANNVSTVALTGNYGDLNSKPVIDTAMNATSTNAVQNKIIKAYVDSTAGSSAAWVISDTAYWSSWDWDTTHAPSKNAVYDELNSMNSDISDLQTASGWATQDISDIKGDITTIQWDITNIQTTVAWKQDTLVSGTNIKTINNESLLGSWNIDITSIVLEWGSMWTFIRGAQQAWTKHSINMGTDKTYTFVWVGYVLVRGYYWWACEINGVRLFYYDFDSWVYNYRYPSTLITMGPWDKVRLWRPWSSWSWDGEVADYY